ncbi:MAG: hypothetical protein QM783_15970 [Phycisphaerales bacterium]
MLKATARLVRLTWEAKAKQVEQRAARRREQIRKLEFKADELIRAAIETPSPEMRRHYEAHVERGKREVAALKEQATLDGTIDTTFEGAVGTVIEFLSKPQRIWENGSLADRRLVLNLAFARPLRYNRARGFGTPDLSLPFSVLAGLPKSNLGMVGPDDERWNQLLEVFQDWAVILKNASI